MLFSSKFFNYSKVPAEVWHSILHKIEDPHTFQSCSKVCSEWHQILQTSRVPHLFPLVLPHINGYLSTQDLINCRRVSKRWRNGVENYLPLDLSWKNVDCSAFKINPEKQYWVSPLGNTFYIAAQLRQFLSQMENCSGNPFPTRTLLFYYLRYPEASPNGADIPVQNREELFSALRALLRRFGDQIWTFVYITDHNYHPPFQAWMQQLFKFLPNLKKLRLQILKEDPRGLQVFDDGWDWFKHLNPLAPHLISFHVGPFFSSRVTGSILQGVGHQLKYLGCEATVVEEASYFGPYTVHSFIREMPALLELNLTRKDLSRGHCETQLLKRLATVSLPKLEKLSCAAEQDTREPPLPFRSILKLFNQFASTLVELYVSFSLKK